MRRALLTAAAARATTASSSSGTPLHVDCCSPLAIPLLSQQSCCSAFVSWPRQLATSPEQLQPRPKPPPNARPEDPNNRTGEATARASPTQWLSGTVWKDAKPVRQIKPGYVIGLGVGAGLAAAGGIAALAEAPALDLLPDTHSDDMVQNRAWNSDAGAACGGACAGLPHGTGPATVMRLQNQAPPHPGSNVDQCNSGTTGSGSRHNIDSSVGNSSSSGGGGGAVSAGGAGGAPSPSPQSQPSAKEPPTSQPAAPPHREGSSYAVYDSQGQPSTLYDMLSSLDSYDVVLLGEYHDDPVAHHLQLQVLRAAAGLPVQVAQNHPHEQQQQQGGDRERGGSAAGSSASSTCKADAIGSTAGGAVGSSSGRGGPVVPRRVVLSLEMFERDVQGIMDEYLAGGAQGGRGGVPGGAGGGQRGNRWSGGTGSQGGAEPGDRLA